MQLSARTLDILNNFTKLNQSIFIKEGSVIKTMNNALTIVSAARVAETFEQPFAIYNLKRFLGVLSLFDNPELSFTNTSIVIQDNNQRVNYTYCDPGLVVYPKGDMGDIKPDATFALSATTLKSVIDASAILQLPEIAVVVENGKLSLRVVNSKNPSADTYRIAITDIDSKDFTVLFKPDSFYNLLPDTYNVEVCRGKFSKFESADLKYWLAEHTTGD